MMGPLLGEEASSGSGHAESMQRLQVLSVLTAARIRSVRPSKMSTKCLTILARILQAAGLRGVSNDGNEHAVDDGVGISRCKGYDRNCNDCLRACGAEASSFPQHGKSFRGRRGVLYNASRTQQTTGLLPVDDMSAMIGRARWAQPNNRKRCDRPRPSS